MALWVIRAGKNGEQEETALKENLVCHGWNELPDYSTCRTKEELRQLYIKKYPDQNKNQVAVNLGQVWRFAHDIKKGDIVALPLKTESAIAFGRITGEYEYKEFAANVMHTRTVKWIKTVPRSTFPEDVLVSLNIPLTVFKVSDAAANYLVKLLDQVSSGDEAETEGPAVGNEDVPDLKRPEIKASAHDEILKFIQAKFKSHALARLVAAVLEAQGYKTHLMPPGPDGGVDILAGSGPLGFDQPRLCVQVKSGNSKADQTTYNELRGVMSKFNCEQGLLVSWGGFTTPVKLDARNDFFKVRLWDQGAVVDAVQDNYERLDGAIKAELPLERIWVTVPVEAEITTSLF
jgi:restriction system protein